MLIFYDPLIGKKFAINVQLGGAGLVFMCSITVQLWLPGNEAERLEEKPLLCFNYGVRKSSNGNFVILLLTFNSTF